MIRIAWEGHFERAAAYDGEKLVGKCEYRDAVKSWTIVHTEVDPAYGGQGIAARLVAAVLDEAKERGIEVRSLCSYASSVMEKRKKEAEQ